MEPTDAAVVGDALHVVIITGRTRYAAPAHPLLRQEAHPIKRPPLGQHGEEPRGAARVHDAAGTRQTGPPHVRTAKHLSLNLSQWLILDSRVVIGQIWRNVLFLQVLRG